MPYLYEGDEAINHIVEVMTEFQTGPEKYEVYNCPECYGNFLVESFGVKSITTLKCPYGCDVTWTLK